MKLKSLLLGAGLALGSLNASALNIVLTNDDGWSTPGIQAMYQVLTEAGHTVVLSGPLDGQSGSAAGFNIGGLEITKEAENQYSVAVAGGETGAEPATSGIVGMQILTEMTGGQAPDLLISGINDGANVAGATTFSGTVGAAIASISYLNGQSVPAIAISADEHCDEELPLEESTCIEVAEFTLSYLNHLLERPAYVNGDDALIPNLRALNINYPAGTPMGVMTARQGLQPLLGGRAIGLEWGCSTSCAELEVGETAEGGILGTIDFSDFEDIDEADSVYFSQGYITVVPIRGSYDGGAQGLKNYLNTYDY
ncbi:hypothetical protein BST95_05235 [Halioglobus japonicus]|uniref:5'-nucleotidase n=1 Tax=Halioglobus japonicus TaxID=930805 RepID=A0AAP8SMK6_9GAMM|nr:5'/3'-nucleotidase SurE [Halioglobus japonicus]AQA17728.1 hypothetical protein BST95_05235 [Halioglobus japonicus]PLW85680.1 hypothetical protein C0029_13800 [Halioglobus japonicus]GHD16913.1 5'-nucleotidase SurE [Halioglobus japonicus]